MNDVASLLAELVNRKIKLEVQDGRLTCHAPQGKLTPDLREAIARLKQNLIQTLSGEFGSVATPDEPAWTFPLSLGQRAHYLMQRWHTEWNHAVAACLRLGAGVDETALAAAWDRVVDRFPILSARIIESDGEPMHAIDAQARPAMKREVLDFSRDEMVVAHFQARAREPFELDRGGLARATLFFQPDGRRGLFLLVNHLIFDGQSVGILIRELFRAYDDVLAGQPPAPGSASAFQRFVTWEANMMASEEGRAHEAYWRQRLATERPVFKLLPEHAGTFDTHRPSRIFDETLPSELADRIRSACKEHGIQPSAFFLGLYFLLLYKHSAQQDLTVLMPVMVRPDKQFAEEVGFFFNVIPIRIEMADDKPLPALLRDVQMALMDGVFHSSFPFSHMLDRQRPDFNVPFGLYYGFQEFSSLSDAAFADVRERHGLEPLQGFQLGGNGDYELALEVFEEEGTFRIAVQGDPTIHPDEVIVDVLKRYVGLLGRAVSQPALDVGAYPLATAAEYEQVVRHNNATETPFARDRRIHDFFLERVELDAEAPAVRFGAFTLTYRELEAATRRLALHLQDKGVGPDRVAAILMDRSVAMMVAIVGTLRAGGAYMPLDPEYPQDRLAYMLDDSKACVVLTQREHRSRVEGLLANDAQIVELDSDDGAIVGGSPSSNDDGHTLKDDVGPEDTAYIIYTSGSTGRPKGVLVQHRALVNRLQWMQDSYPLGVGDVVVQKTPYCFDVSVWEFLWTPMTGALLVFAAPDGHMDAHYMRQLVVAERVTAMHFVPSMLHTFLDHSGGPCPDVRFVFCSGEALDAESVRRYRDVFPHAALHNLYGPTEAAIDVTAFDCSRLDLAFVPIGKPISNTQIHILDERGNPQPPDVPGELYIAGANVAKGYLNRPELTAERFVANPFAPGQRMYRTGDLARWLRDGNIQYLGRIDHQVKIGGVRIETGEIEARLASFPGMAACAVIARGSTGYAQLVAFYQMRDSSPGRLLDVPQAQLRAHLQERLPEYMMPVAFVSVVSIPVTSNGKADRRALQQLEVGIEPRERYEPPATETERELASIWVDVFKEKGFVPSDARIGAHDNFFDLGGNSLLATQLLYTIRSKLQVELPIRSLFERVTIRDLASEIDAMRASR